MISRRSLIFASAAAMFNSNGTIQATVDLNLRPQPVVGADATTLSGRTQVDPSTLVGAVHIIFIGQSTNSNAVNGSPATPANAASIYNLSIAHKGACFLGINPLLSSDTVLGHHGLYLADSLITAGTATKVLLTNIICGGNYFADWAPGGGVVGGATPGTRTGELAYRIGLTARCIANAGLTSLKTIIDHQGGEWDSDNTGTTESNATAALNGIITEFKRVGLLRTGNVMFVNQNTRITNTSGNRNPIRAAQAAVVDEDLVRAGFDVDTLDDSNRYDGTHFTPTGAAAQAAGKLPFHTDFILNG